MLMVPPARAQSPDDLKRAAGYSTLHAGDAVLAGATDGRGSADVAKATKYELTTAIAQLPTQVAAARYSALHAGDAVLVFQHDSVVFEQYQNGWKAEAPHPLASGTKAFGCVLAALASGDKLLNLDQPTPQIDPQIAQILGATTVRQLLNLTSGLSADENGNLIRVSPPGQRFAYGGVSFLVFNQLLASKVPDGDVVAYLKRRIFTPLGITSVTMQPGNLASGAALTARDWGRFGELLLDRGRAPNGRQLVPAAGLAECGKGSDANPYYGMGVWLNPAPLDRGPAPHAPPSLRSGRRLGVTVQRADSTDRIISAPDLPHDLLLAAGTGGQRLYILPSQGLVVVRFGHNTGPDFKDDQFLRLLFGN
jgi:CubicO group peptidase (beta-lactamase class C family)